MIFSLTLRHMRVFFRDRAAVFFSLLSPLILFALYFLFLGSLNLSSLKEALPMVSEKKLEVFLNTWVYAGIVMTTAVTTGLAALSVFVSDRETGRFIDLAVSPIARWKVVTSYLLSTMVIAFVMTTIVYVLSQAYLILQGANLPSFQDVSLTVVNYLLVIFSFAALSSLAVTFIKSSAAFTSLSVIVGTAIGFLAGIYVPLGQLSSSISNVLNALPFAQSAVLIREPFIKQALADVSMGQPVEVAAKLTDTFGLDVVIGNYHMPTSMIIAVLAILGFIALGLAIIQITRRIR